MYNRYIPSGASCIRVAGEDAPGPGPAPPPPPPSEGARAGGEKRAGEGAGVLAGLLKGLKLDRLDGGDVLLILLLLFLLREGDDLELLIALGLLLLLGLD